MKKYQIKFDVYKKYGPIDEHRALSGNVPHIEERSAKTREDFLEIVKTDETIRKLFYDKDTSINTVFCDGKEHFGLAMKIIDMLRPRG